MASQYIRLERDPDAGLVLFEHYLRRDPAAWGDWLHAVAVALADGGEVSPGHVVRIDGKDVSTD